MPEDSPRRGRASARQYRKPSCRLEVQGATEGPGGPCVHPPCAGFWEWLCPPALPPASPSAPLLCRASQHQLGSVPPPRNVGQPATCFGQQYVAEETLSQCLPRPHEALHTSPPPPGPPTSAVQTSPGWSAGELGTQGSVTPHPSHVCRVVLN